MGLWWGVSGRRGGGGVCAARLVRGPRDLKGYAAVKMEREAEGKEGA